jgi:hypothetical protein
MKRTFVVSFVLMLGLVLGSLTSNESTPQFDYDSLMIVSNQELAHAGYSCHIDTFWSGGWRYRLLSHVYLPYSKYWVIKHEHRYMWGPAHTVTSWCKSAYY